MGLFRALPLVVALAGGGVEPAADNDASAEDVKTAGDKAGSPGGISGAVQFNDAGDFGGAAGLFWNAKTRRLGIGTKSPARRLEIRDPVTPAMSITDGSGTLELAVATASGFFSNVATPGDAVIRIPGGGGEDLILAVRNGNNGALRFTTGTTADEAERMTITSTGNVGIGTTTPNEQLEITGNLRLPASSANSGVIKYEDRPFIHTAGNENTFVGIDAGNFEITGYGNTGVGLTALKENTEGTCNIAVGGEALQQNTVGNNNTAVGHHAMTMNDNGHDNTATGTQALHYNVSGSRNTATGNNALVNNVDGHDNTADGVFVLGSNVSGSANTASGVDAMRNNIHGSANTAGGFRALYQILAGDYNTAAGANALFRNYVGSFNTAAGPVPWRATLTVVTTRRSASRPTSPAVG